MPKQAICRAEAMVTLNRVLKRGPLKGVSKPSWSDVNHEHWTFADIEETSVSHQAIRNPDGSEQLMKVLK